MPKVVLFANTDWYIYNFRLPLAKALRDEGYEVVLISPPGPYGERLEQAGFRWHAMPMNRRSLNPLRELGVLYWLTRFFGAEAPDVVHGFTIKSAVYGALAARLAGVRGRISAVAGMGYVFSSLDLKAKLLRPLVRWLIRVTLNTRGSVLVLQNPDDVDLFNRFDLVSPERIRLIKGSGVNCEKFTPRALPTLGDSVGDTAKRPLTVLLAARLLWDKGIAEYVEAARLLRSEGRNIKFLLAGASDEGNPAAVDPRSLEEWVAASLIEWLGHVSEMPSLLAKIDVMVLPSYREGLPKTLIEAGACEVPLVTTDAPGCREVVSKHGVDGLIVPVRDGAALADAIRQLDDDEDLRIRLGRAARKKVLEEFEEKIVICKTLGVYRELRAPR